MQDFAERPMGTITMPDSTTQTIRVLLAEDDDNARTLLVDLLNTLGHVVVAEVATGREAYLRAQELVPDVVLLDVHMPDGSGIEAAEKITGSTPGVAVVLLKRRRRSPGARRGSRWCCSAATSRSS
jgi:CheY-like chemotaxis protein